MTTENYENARLKKITNLNIHYDSCYAFIEQMKDDLKEQQEIVLSERKKFIKSLRTLFPSKKDLISNLMLIYAFQQGEGHLSFSTLQDTLSKLNAYYTGEKTGRIELSSITEKEQELYEKNINELLWGIIFPRCYYIMATYKPRFMNDLTQYKILTDEEKINLAKRLKGQIDKKVSLEDLFAFLESYQTYAFAIQRLGKILRKIARVETFLKNSMFSFLIIDKEMDRYEKQDPSFLEDDIQ